MENGCERCGRNCCVDFKVAMEVNSPREWKRILEANPRFKKTSADVIMVGNRERVVGVYNCDQFDRDSGRCRDYGGRPAICREAGEEFAPHPDCLLFKSSGKRNG